MNTDREQGNHTDGYEHMATIVRQVVLNYTHLFHMPLFPFSTVEFLKPTSLKTCTFDASLCALKLIKNEMRDLAPIIVH